MYLCAVEPIVSESVIIMQQFPPAAVSGEGGGRGGLNGLSLNNEESTDLTSSTL